MSSCFHFTLNFSPHSFPKPYHNTTLHCPFPLSKPCRTTLVVSSFSSSGYEREEARWIREESRWMREEQRWLREESRWEKERERLVAEISELKAKLEELEGRGESVPSDATLLPILKRITEIGPGSTVPLVLEAATTEEEKVDAVKEVAGEVKKRGILRKGSEGDEVKAMQEALQKSGFYCGEEDEEFSSFDSGTERAVKTWQASLDLPQDGIMTAELQEKLYAQHQVEYSSVVLKKDHEETAITKDSVNGGVVASVTEISEVKHKVVENNGKAEIDVTHNRVFLLGENRWEEPSRLIGKSKIDGGATSKYSSTKCLTCQGEGSVLCSECDGSGEPNIEEQFMDWVDEGAKCPYCEGHGFTTCDVCDGKGEAPL